MNLFRGQKVNRPINANTDNAPYAVGLVRNLVHEERAEMIHYTSNYRKSLNTSRALNTSRGSDLIVLIEAGP